MRYLFCLGALLFAGAIAAQNAEGEILRLVHSKFEWFKTHQYDSITALVDENLQYIHSNAWVESARDIIENLKTGKLVYKKVDLDEVKVRLIDQTAVVTGRGWFEGINAGSPFAVRLLFTEVYVQQHGRWKLVNRHACRIP